MLDMLDASSIKEDRCIWHEQDESTSFSNEKMTETRGN